MDNFSDTYWEKCWNEEDVSELLGYLKAYENLKSEEIEIFKQHGLKKICDAACGFGAYSLAFFSNGFEICGFDISAKAVEIARKGLRPYGVDPANYKVASIVDTGYEDEAFDGVVAHSVIDHMTSELAEKAVNELLRITAKGGLVLLSFDTAEQEDYETEHILLEDGSMEYTDGHRKGMIFRPYDWDMIDKLLGNHSVVSKRINQKNEQMVVIQKTSE